MLTVPQTDRTESYAQLKAPITRSRAGWATAARLSSSAAKKIRKRSQLSMTQLAANPRPTKAIPAPLATSRLRKPPARIRAPIPAALLAATKARLEAVSPVVLAVAVTWDATRRSSNPRQELVVVRNTLSTRPKATAPTANAATAATAVITTAVSLGNLLAVSLAPLTTTVRPRATAPTTGSMVAPTVAPRLRVPCVSWAMAVAVVFMRFSYSCSTEPETSLLAISNALRSVSIWVSRGAMAAMDSSPNSRLMMEFRSSGRTFSRASRTRITAPLASCCSSFCNLFGSISRYL